jgi:hypothetical protein
MARASGEASLAALPAWLGDHIQLTMYFYPSTLKRVRDRLERDRTGIAIIEVGAPVNAPTLEIALDRRDLYLHGFRGKGRTNWNRFTPKTGRAPDLPGGRHRNLPSDGSYPDLGMRGAGVVKIDPVKLLCDLAACDGSVSGAEGWRGVLLLILLTSEALRFDSVMLAGARYLGVGPGAGAYDVPSVADIVTNWASATARGSRDVLLPHLP